jgi:1,4-dihydroxy-2-naphthoate octaprenyltransferase
LKDNSLRLADILGPILKFLQIARPQFLIVGLALFLFGALWAVLLGAPFSLARLLLGYLVVMPAHLSVSYSNDYFDVEVDRLGKPTLVSGGSGILVQHPELRAAARRMAILLILCSFVMGIIFWMLYDYPFWYLGLVLLGNLLGWFYSAPPLKLAYRGLGEFSTMFTSGFLLPMMGYFVTRGSVDRDGLIFLIPFMLYGLAFILLVHIPDMEVDRLGHKHTWVALRGRAFGFTLAGIALLCATIFIFLLPQLFPGTYPLDFRVLGWMSLLPLASGLVGLVKRPAERQAAIKLVLGNVVSLALFCLLADGYLIYLAGL